LGGQRSDPFWLICSSFSWNTVFVQYRARIMKERIGPCRVWRFSSKLRVRSFVLRIRRSEFVFYTDQASRNQPFLPEMELMFRSALQNK
jgi:hypothetical protein